MGRTPGWLRRNAKSAMCAPKTRHVTRNARLRRLPERQRAPITQIVVCTSGNATASVTGRATDVKPASRLANATLMATATPSRTR